MAADIDELKQDVEELKVLSQDTNRVVHKLRRNIWWGRLWTIAWWAAIIGLSGATYYLYAQPYVEKARQAYTSFQHSANQAEGWESQASQFFSKYLGGATTTRP